MTRRDWFCGPLLSRHFAEHVLPRLFVDRLGESAADRVHRRLRRWLVSAHAMLGPASGLRAICDVGATPFFASLGYRLGAVSGADDPNLLVASLDGAPSVTLALVIAPWQMPLEQTWQAAWRASLSRRQQDGRRLGAGDPRGPSQPGRSGREAIHGTRAGHGAAPGPAADRAESWTFGGAPYPRGTMGRRRGRRAGSRDSLSAPDCRRWALCFNARRLRLVDLDRPYARRFLEFDLAETLADPARTRLLWSVTRAAAFSSFAGRPPLVAEIVAACDAHGVGVREALQGGVRDALELLCADLARAARRSRRAGRHTRQREARRDTESAPDGTAPRGMTSPADVVSQSLTLLYRILFLLFAEARALVPVWHPIYRDSYSIGTLQRSAERPSPRGLWEALQAISRLAHAGCETDEFSMTAFNGQLFSPDGAPLVDRARLDSATIARVLHALMTAPATRGRGRERITYADLGVEQLGAVYERILDYAPRLEATATAHLTGRSVPSMRSLPSVASVPSLRTRASKADDGIRQRSEHAGAAIEVIDSSPHIERDALRGAAAGSGGDPRPQVESSARTPADDRERDPGETIRTISTSAGRHVEPSAAVSADDERPQPGGARQTVSTSPRRHVGSSAAVSADDERPKPGGARQTVSTSARRHVEPSAAVSADDERPQPGGARQTVSSSARRPSVRRKESGTFYTPRGLADALVRDTLGPLTAGASADAILALRVLDPAMGSGAFLVSACHFLAEAYEQALVREHRPPPATEAARAAIRRAVARHCLFGVDLNPMAVQLARLSLWLTTLTADAPLTFLDHHLRAGDSLIGASLDDLARRLPARPLSASAHASRSPPRASRGARASRGTRGTRGAPTLPLFMPDDASRLMRAILPTRSRLTADDDRPETVREKERLLATLGGDEALVAWHTLADLWCASWFAGAGDESPEGEGPPPLPQAAWSAMCDHVLRGQSTLPASLAEAWLAHARGEAERRRFFHWTLEFPEVFFDVAGEPRPDGGFDAIVGNPPWDMVRDDARPQAAFGRFVRETGIYDSLGDAHANSYQLFVDRSLALLRSGGRLGLVVPWGLAADHGSARLRRRLIERCDVDTMVSFDNRAGLFPIHRGLRFLLFTCTTGRPTTSVSCRFGEQDPAVLDRPAGVDRISIDGVVDSDAERGGGWSGGTGSERAGGGWIGSGWSASDGTESGGRENVRDGGDSGRAVRDWRSRTNAGLSIAPALLRRLSGESLAFPDIRTRADLALVERLHATFPALTSRDGWGVTFGRELNITDDRARFVAAGPSEDARGPIAGTIAGANASDSSRLSTSAIAHDIANDISKLRALGRANDLPGDAAADLAGQIAGDAAVPGAWQVAANHDGEATGKAAKDSAGRSDVPPGNRGWPAIEGKHLRPFAVHPDEARFLVPPGEAAVVRARVPAIVRHRLAYRDVSSPANRLTLMAAIVPPWVVTTHTLFCLRSPLDLEAQHCLCALMNSFVANYLVRLRVSTHVTVALLDHLPMPMPTPHRFPARSSEPDPFRTLAALAADLSQFPPRQLSRADAYIQLQALAAHAYGLTPAEFRHVLSTFPLIEREEKEAVFNTFRGLTRRPS